MATTLFDVRYYRHSRKRLLHWRDPRGAYVATVNAIENPTGRAAPDNNAIGAALPHYLRKAFNRSHWERRDALNENAYGSRTLYGVRGALLGTLYATRRVYPAA